MSLMLHCDFSQKDWVGFQRASDPPQLMGITSVDIRDLYKAAGGVGASIANGALFNRYDADRAKYGKGTLEFTTGTTSGVEALIGFDGASSFNTALLTGNHTCVLWARVTSGNPAGNTFSIRHVANTATLVSQTTGITLTTSWQKLTTTGTAGASVRHIRLTRTGGSTALTIQLAGAMIVAGATAPDYFNGGAVTLLDDLTDYFLENSKWGLGWVKPYQYVAPVGKADLRLSNADKRFSPEYASGPLYGNLLPNLLVQIADPDYGIWWTGWTDSWAPEPGTNRDKFAVLRATDARRLMGRKLPVLPLYTGAAWRSIVGAILAYFTVPNSGDAVPINGTAITGDAWIGIGTDVVATDYYADNVPYDHDGVKVMGDLIGAQQAKLWCGREGGYEIRMGTGTTSPANYVAIDSLWTDIGNIETGMIINDVEVMGRKRILQTSGPYTIWTLDETFEIPGSGTESFRIYFTHSNESKTMVGAGGTFAITETNSGVAGDITAALSDIGAQSAIITYTNNNAAARTVLTTTVTATERVSQLREFSKETEDATSIAANGILSERLDFSFVQSRSHAKKLANYRVARFKDVRWEAPWVEIDVDKNPSEALSARVGAAVHIEDDQTGHDAYYAVIGEQHTVKDGLTDHTVKLYLEPIYQTAVDAS